MPQTIVTPGTDPDLNALVELRDGKFFKGQIELTRDEAIEEGWDPETEQPDPADLVGKGKDKKRQAVEKAAKSAESATEMTAAERKDAVDWFMSDDPEEEAANKRLLLNVSTNPAKPMEIEWVIKALPRERIQEIRDTARKQARKRRGGDEDSAAVPANLRIAAEGTLYPNLKDPKVRGEFLDPADAMNYRFRNKSGLIDQICAYVIEVSGYSEDDVSEVDAVKI